MKNEWKIIKRSKRNYEILKNKKNYGSTRTRASAKNAISFYKRKKL